MYRIESERVGVSKNQLHINYVNDLAVTMMTTIMLTANRCARVFVPSANIKLKNEWVKVENSSSYGKRIWKWWCKS